LNELTDLPKVEDMAEALGIEGTLLVERTPREEELPLDESDEGSALSGPDVRDAQGSNDSEPGSGQTESAAESTDIESVH
jgi:hypothetical protein